MARLKKTSEVITKAETRVNALQAIDEALNLNAGLTLAVYEAKIAEAKAKLGVYNTQLSVLDKLLNEFQAVEKELKTLSARMLAGVGFVYGKDSSEYEQAGGTRTSEINYK